MLTSQPPAPGTRPKDRREVTIAAATELFSRRGYQNVSVAEIARATNVGSSAIFRHFPTKADLLLAATRRPLARIEQILDAAAHTAPTPDRLPALLPVLAAFSLDHREAGVLWQREARVLDGAAAHVVRDDLRRISRLVAGLISAHRPELDGRQADLLAWCMLGALVSISFHSVSLPRTRYVALLVELMSAVVSAELPVPEVEPVETRVHEAAVSTSSTAGGSRRGELLDEAIRLFAERGYGTVAVDDIGSAAGIAGPSVYSHFASKQELLVAAMERGSSILRAEAISALVETDDAPAGKLRRLVDSYLGLALTDRFVLRIVLSEVGQLDGAARETARREQREYIARWVALRGEATGEDPVEARIRVQAVLLVINDAVQTPHLREQAGFADSLRSIAMAVLQSP